MASSNSLGSSTGGGMEAWGFRPTASLADAWVLEALARDSEESLTKVLKESISGSQVQAVAPAPVFSGFGEALAPGMATGSPKGSASDADGMALKRRRIDGDNTTVNGAKRAKRKAKRSSRTTTTFIAADPTNFREMVQQVTGVRFTGNGPQQVAPMVLKPEPQRPAAKRVLNGSYCLPTLDTSAFLLDHHQYHYQYQRPPVMDAEAQAGSGVATEAAQPVLAADGGIGFDFDSFPSFPTLESGRVM